MASSPVRCLFLSAGRVVAEMRLPIASHWPNVTGIYIAAPLGCKHRGRMRRQGTGECATLATKIHRHVMESYRHIDRCGETLTTSDYGTLEGDGPREGENI